MVCHQSQQEIVKRLRHLAFYRRRMVFLNLDLLLLFIGNFQNVLDQVHDVEGGFRRLGLLHLLRLNQIVQERVVTY